jgi:hypothetical protein
MLTRRQLVLAQKAETKDAFLLKLASDMAGAKDEARALMRTFKIAGLLKKERWQKEFVDDVSLYSFEYHLTVPGIPEEDVDKFDYVLAQLKNYIGYKAGLRGGRSRTKHGNAELSVRLEPSSGKKYTMTLFIQFKIPKEFQQQVWKNLYKEIGGRGLEKVLVRL